MSTNESVLDLSREVYNLRVIGWPYKDIAQKLGLPSAEDAVELVRAVSVQEKAPETIEEHRALDVYRVDDLLKGLWIQARSGNLAYLDRVIKLMDRRSKLLGLDMPAKTALTSADGKQDLVEMLSDRERASRIRVLLGIETVAGSSEG